VLIAFAKEVTFS